MRKPVRKRFVVKKRHSQVNTNRVDPGPSSSVEDAGSSSSVKDVQSIEDERNLNSVARESVAGSNPPERVTLDSFEDTLVLHHAKVPAGDINEDFTQEAAVPQQSPPEVSLMVLEEVCIKIKMFLTQRSISYIHQNAVNVVFMCAGGINPSIQRSLTFYTDGEVELFVHRHKLEVEPYMEGTEPFIPLDLKTVDLFVDRAVSVINKVKAMRICSGYDDVKFQNVWSRCPFGFIDTNPYNEISYEETFRSHNCTRLINSRRWRCAECAKLYKPLKRRSVTAAEEQPNLHTANKCLTEQQMMHKLQDMRRDLDNTKKQNYRLRKRMDEFIEKNGVQLDQNLSNDLSALLEGGLENGSVNPAQQIFLQQQVKASQKKNMVGMRWHPTMIRLALAIHLTSPAAYEVLKNTGMVKLPSSRTLFDYSHVKPVAEGIDQVALDSLGEKILKFQKKYMLYFVLMADEMHISQNLVFQKHSGRLIGYTCLDSLDNETKVFEQYLENPDKVLGPMVASKVLVCMTKGVANGVKEVVATFAVGNPSVSQMYDWTWKVIRALESSRVYIIAFVCDGFSTNRAFIRMHTPVTKLDSGVIFDTVDKAAPHRVLYFISDVPHLLKTTRNCLLNSRSRKNNSRRCMVRNGKKISWDFIIKLYDLKKGKSLRKSFKLSAMNVYPDSYARMKVKYAAEVLSRTVAQDLEDQNWNDAVELIKFIRLVNDWFDCLNGARSGIAKKKRNKNLDRYSSPDDSRFAFLEEFLDYLASWKKECETCNISVNTTKGIDTSTNSAPGGIDESDMEDERTDEPETPASKRILSKQTLEGIEMTTRAFPLMVKFLLSEGTVFINARIFTQDPLEQHFSKVRAGQGGSTNPNVGQVLNRNRALHTIGQLNMKRKKGNTEQLAETVEVTTEKLPKRKCLRGPKFVVE